ncbi:MAG: hypothetical protein ACLFQW_13145, partial [Spirochaetaceae bacterium]
MLPCDLDTTHLTTQKTAFSPLLKAQALLSSQHKSSPERSALLLLARTIIELTSQKARPRLLFQGAQALEIIYFYRDLSLYLHSYDQAGRGSKRKSFSRIPKY